MTRQTCFSSKIKKKKKIEITIQASMRWSVVTVIIRVLRKHFILNFNMQHINRRIIQFYMKNSNKLLKLVKINIKYEKLVETY